MDAVDRALENIAYAYAFAYHLAKNDTNDDCEPPGKKSIFNTDAKSIFLKIHGGRITINWVTYLSEYNAWGLGAWSNAIRIYRDAPLDRMSQEFDYNYMTDELKGGRLGRFITHEMGHVFENAYNNNGAGQVGRNMVSDNPQIVNRKGFAGRFLQWQWSHDITNYEIFADMFVGWVYKNWMEKPANEDLLPDFHQGLDKSRLMEKCMPIWVTDIMERK
jgi:hypothetical protein